MHVYTNVNGHRNRPLLDFLLRRRTSIGVMWIPIMLCMCWIRLHRHGRQRAWACLAKQRLKHPIFTAARSFCQNIHLRLVSTSTSVDRERPVADVRMFPGTNYFPSGNENSTCLQDNDVASHIPKDRATLLPSLNEAAAVTRDPSHDGSRWPSKPVQCQ